MATVYIGMGSNQGERQAHLQHALQHIQALPATNICCVSALYETEALTLPGQQMQPSFYNAVIGVQTRQPPFALLKSLQAIELLSGRAPSGVREKWSQRSLDLDILSYQMCGGAQVYSVEQALSLPHTEATKRWCVLKPWADIAPEVVPSAHSAKTVRAWLESMEIPNGAKMVARKKHWLANRVTI